MYADDMADACVFLMQNYSGSDFVNIGTGEDVTIRELTEMVALTVGYKGEIDWDATKPDGMERKLLDVSRLHALGWHHQHSMHEGLLSAYQDILAHAERSPCVPETPAPAPACRLDPRQIEVMDPDMVPVLRRKTPAERLQNSYAIWESACSMLQSHLSHTHRDWTPEHVRREVAHRMSHG
jgi:hypothetical protein